MTIPKKSLISSLNTTKKAIVASSASPAENPTVSAPITSRTRVSARIKAAVSIKNRVKASVGIRNRVVAKKRAK